MLKTHRFIFLSKEKWADEFAGANNEDQEQFMSNDDEINEYDDELNTVIFG